MRDAGFRLGYSGEYTERAATSALQAVQSSCVHGVGDISIGRKHSQYNALDAGC